MFNYRRLAALLLGLFMLIACTATADMASVTDLPAEQDIISESPDIPDIEPEIGAEEEPAADPDPAEPDTADEEEPVLDDTAYYLSTSV